MKRATRVLFVFLIISLVACKASDHGSLDNPTNLSAPRITGMNPSMVNPGVENIEGHILGTNLAGIVSVTLGDGVDLQQFSHISDSDLYVFFSVSRDTTPGPRTITVSNAGGAATSSTVFSIGDHPVPVAMFTVRPSVGLKGVDTLRFDASNSLASGGISDYVWRPGDGTTLHGRIVDHKYTRAGNFDAQLTITDSRGTSAQTSRFVEILASRPPIARFTMTPASGDTTTHFHFDASASHDPDDHISAYYWSFGDGTSAKGVSVEHQFLRSGAFFVTLTVVDITHESAFISRIAVVGGSGGGPPPPPPPTGGTQCTSQAPKGPTLFGTIISVDTASRQAVIQFSSSASCATAFYQCGDLKDGYFNGAPERWFGAICGMWDLGNNTFRIQLGGGNAFPPPVPDATAWIHWQDCSGAGNYCH